MAVETPFRAVGHVIQDAPILSMGVLVPGKTEQ